MKVQQSLELIERALRDHARVAVACSFGKDSVVVLDLARRVRPDVRVFTVMTRFKPPETFEYKDRLVERWGLDVDEYTSDVEIPERLYETDPDECCRLLKVEPTRRAVRDLDCWISGLRNTEGRTRADYAEVEVRNGLVKLNPILAWTEADVWRYIAVREIPVHPWYARGYRSLGCAPCSVPGGELERDGRWKGTSKCGGECGIHTQVLR